MPHPSSDELLIARLFDLPAEDRTSFWHRACVDDPSLPGRHPEFARLFSQGGPPNPSRATTTAPLSAGAMIGALAAALGPTNDAAPGVRIGPMADVLKSALGGAEHEAPGVRIGHYKLLQKIGEGGFGAVWMAEQLEPIRRRVAMKIVKVGMDTEEVIARFEVERQALAMMDHPNIARVFDAGATASGRPYFVMELVRGVAITRYCDDNRLSAEDRLRLFISVCQAVQHAHQKGVIHRDLKPSNILVTVHDGTPVPKVIDFGIAKATDKQLTEKTLVTQFHAFVGTPAYTSPEQMEMSGLDVDTRSDIYSLGVLLYELLTGRPPFDPDALVKSGLDAMRRTIREVDPPRPSIRLGTLTDEDRTSVAGRRSTDAARLSVLLRGDLDWIAMRCLEKDRTRRYETANGLARDLERHLAHEPVTARPPSTLYRAQKFVRRHKLGVVAIAAVTLSLIGGLVASSTLFVRERSAHERAVVAEQAESRLRQKAEADRAVEARRSSRTSQAFAEQLLKEGRTGEGLAHFVRAARSDPTNFSIGPRLISALAYRSFALPVGEPISDVDNAGYTRDGRRIWTFRFDGADRNSISNFSRHWRPYSWMNASAGVLQVRDLAGGTHLHTFNVKENSRGIGSPDGRWFAIAGEDGAVTILDLASGRTELRPIKHGSGIVDIVYSPDGRWLGTAGMDRTAKIWNAATGELQATLRHTTPFHSINFSQDSRQIITTTRTGPWRIWQVPSGNPLTPEKSARLNANLGVFAPDGSVVVITDNSGAQIFDAASGYSVGRQLNHAGPSYFAQFSADGSLLVTTSNDATARLWEMPSGKPLHAPLPHGGAVVHALFTPDGRHLITNSGEGMVRVWDVRTGRLAQEPIRTGHVLRIDLSRDGSEFLTYGRDRTVQRWRVAPGAIEPVRLPADLDRLHIRIDPDTIDTAWVLYRQRLQKIDLLSGRDVGAPRPLPVTIWSAGTLARGAERACVNVGPGEWEIWDLSGPEIVRHPLGRFTQLTSRVFSPDSSRLVANDSPQSIRVFDTRNGAVVLGPIANASRYYAFSPDSRQLVVSMQDNTATIWNLANGSRAGHPLRHGALLQAVQFSPDGRLIATGAQDGTAQLWDARSTRPVGPPLIHGGIVRNVAFSRDSRRLLTADPLEARLWDVATGSALTSPMVGGNDMTEAILADDETRIATWARTEGDLRIWDGASGVLLTDTIRMGERVQGGSLRFLPTGRFLLANVYTGPFAYHIWPVPPPAQPHPVPNWLLRLASAVAGGEIDAGAGFREHSFDAMAFDQIRRELDALPREAPLAEWGRWFLADRATRPIGPGFRITAAEVEELGGRKNPASVLVELDREAIELRRMGRFAEALVIEQRMLTLASERWGEQSLEVAFWLVQHAWTLIKAQRAADAEAAARTAITIREKLLGVASYELAIARSRLGWALLEQRRYSEAESVLTLAYDGISQLGARTELTNPQREYLAETAGLLARLFEETRDSVRALEWRQKATATPAATVAP